MSEDLKEYFKECGTQWDVDNYHQYTEEQKERLKATASFHCWHLRSELRKVFINPILPYITVMLDWLNDKIKRF